LVRGEDWKCERTYGKLAGTIVDADMSDMDGVFGSRDGGPAGGFEQAGYAKAALLLGFQFITETFRALWAG
jgi:hypothetical protein